MSLADTLTEKTLGGFKVQQVMEQEPFINFFVYGPFGAGKTILAGSASEVEEMSPVLFIDIEGGTFSLRAHYPNVEVVRVKSWMEMQKLYEELYKMQHGYRTVVLDSLTEIQKFSMYGIMKEVKAKDSERDVEVPSLREYLKNGEQTRVLVRAFRDLPMHTIFTALERSEKDQRSGAIKVFPSLGGQLRQEIGGFLDIVTYMYRKQVMADGDTEPTWHRMLLTALTDTHVAKDRSGALPELVVDPDFRMLYNYMMRRDQAA